jgi:TonB family protein
MAAGALTRGWSGPSRRRVPRFQVQAPLDVTVLRSGIPDTVPGRSVNVCERGIAAMLAGELVAGEVVGVEVRLPLVADPLRARAMVRYQDKLRCGLEFLGLTAEQRSGIRDWAKVAKAETEITSSPTPALDPAAVVEKKSGEGRGNWAGSGGAGSSGVSSGGSGSGGAGSGGSGSGGGPTGKSKKRRRMVWAILVVLAAIAVAVLWWKWNRDWEELESGLKSREVAAAEKPQAQVPAEVMEKLLVHRVEPVYPVEARRANLQGIIALDIVVGRDGSVVSMRALNGPEVLVRAAMDALRWWKFEPYRVNGEPAVVESTVAVEFKR